MEANLRGVVQFCENLPLHLRSSTTAVFATYGCNGEKDKHRQQQRQHSTTEITIRISHTYARIYMIEFIFQSFR